VAITPEAGTPSAAWGLGNRSDADFFQITGIRRTSTPLRIAERTHRAFHRSQERGPADQHPADYFYGEIDVKYQPQRIEGSAGGSESLEAAAKMLAGASFPVILAGGGIVMSRGVDETKALAEYLSCPVVTSYLHNDAFPSRHELACGPLGYQGSKAAMRLIAKADVVLALGTRLGPFGTLPQYGLDYWPQNAKIIQIDADSRVLGLVKKVSLAICGDARLAAAELLRRLAAAAGTPRRNQARIREIAEQKASWAKELENWPSPSEAGRIGPRRALQELSKAMPKNAMVSTDIGNVCSVANSYLHFEAPPSFLAAMSWGNCGYAFPTAIGAKVARPDRPAIAYVGDGAWGMSIAETMTCVRENIPVVAVVFDNAHWGAEKKYQIDYFCSRFLGTNLENPDFAEIARAMGAEGITVDHADQVGDALRAAVDTNKPTVLNLRLTQELADLFRRDAFKQPKRLLDKYKSFSAVVGQPSRTAREGQQRRAPDVGALSREAVFHSSASQDE
jgi:sulfoacetaldehyde acetyltransferase